MKMCGFWSAVFFFISSYRIHCRVPPFLSIRLLCYFGTSVRERTTHTQIVLLGSPKHILVAFQAPTMFGVSFHCFGKPIQCIAHSSTVKSSSKRCASSNITHKILISALIRSKQPASIPNVMPFTTLQLSTSIEHKSLF